MGVSVSEFAPLLVFKIPHCFVKFFEFFFVGVFREHLVVPFFEARGFLDFLSVLLE